jgi:large subunit ribosomal protein LP0
MEPGKTSFFQALGVPTKIARGTIEITTDLKLIEAGNKVGASEATLLNLLNISYVCRPRLQCCFADLA